SNSRVYLHLKPIEVVEEVLYHARFSVDKAGKTITVDPPVSSSSNGNSNGRKVYYFDDVFDATRAALTKNINELPKNIYDQTSLMSEIRNVVISPLMSSLVVHGLNVTFLGLGISGSGKSTLLSGPKKSVLQYSDKAEGIIPTVASELFNTLKCDNIAHEINKISSSDKIFIFQLVRDLIDTSKDGLRVEDDPIYGSRVSGITSLNVENEYECLEIIQKAQSNVLEAYDPVASNNSFIFTQFELCRFEFEASSEYKINQNPAIRNFDKASGEVVSRFVIVDTCGAEKFFEDPTKLIMSSGLYVSKSVIAFWNALKEFGRPRPDQPAYYDFSLATSTQLLSDIFGGNSVTVFFVTLDLTPPSTDLNLNKSNYNSRSGKSWNRSMLNLSQMLRWL
ncbi:hypothetical protein HK096_008924, partial [Nowakowskiella sp. JEL0078]